MLPTYKGYSLCQPKRDITYGNPKEILVMATQNAHLLCQPKENLISVIPKETL